MAERWTAASAPGVPGIAESGRRSHAEMVAAFRRWYEHLADEASRALALSDDEITVETFLGIHAMRNREPVAALPSPVLGAEDTGVSS